MRRNQNAPIVKPKLPDTMYGGVLICPICGEEIKEWQDYEVSQRSKYTNVYVHSICVRNQMRRDTGVRLK